MKIDKEAVKKLAIRELQYNTGSPLEATLRAIETWMGRQGLEIKKKDNAQSET